MQFFLRVCGIFVFACTSLGLWAEEPFAFEKTPGKLPKEIVPLAYQISLTPELEKALFTGHVTIQLEVRAAVKEIVLNALALEITHAELHTRDAVAALVPKLDAMAQTLTLPLGQGLPPGRYTLELAFSGKLTEQPQGLYLTRFQKDGAQQQALVTQFEATDARRMFPCWDEPVFRATFQLSVTLPEKAVAVSNMPPAREVASTQGLRTIDFQPTPKMPTYLLAFAAGDLEKIEDTVDGVQLGIFVTPGKKAQALYAMEATKKILHYYHDYFGTKYPLPKLDQVAFPSSGASGMENWGCIIYNENSLLYDPAASSQATKERVFAVVAHEIAHQWFGDLVTMAWWDNLWLNEGFASWMGTRATDHFNPEWKTWLRAASGKEWAMNLDARSTTHPIQQPVQDEAQAMDAFDEITYQKGQAVIRMIESWLGEDAFRAGIRSYLEKHALSNTTTADLWNALGENSGKDVLGLAAGWTQQPGFPLVRVAKADSTGDQTSVRLAQERFVIHQKNPAPLAWKVPLRIGNAGDPQRAETLLLESATAPVTTVEGEDVGVKANLGDVGYFRVAYDALLFHRLRKATPHLAEVDRLNLLNDTWALVKAEQMKTGDYLDLASAIADAPSATELEQILGVLWEIDSLARGTPEREGFRAWARAFLRPHFARLGWDFRAGESSIETQLRASLIRILGAFDDEAIFHEASARFAKYREDAKSLDGNLRGAVFTIVGRRADAATWETLHALAQAQDSYEQKRALYAGLAGAHDPARAAKTLALSITDELIAPEAAALVGRVSREAEQPELAWDFARAHLEVLLAKLPSLGANHYIPGLFRAFDDAARADELEAFAKANLPPSAAPAVAKVADDIRFRAELKARVLPEIAAWWKARAHP